jgi:hypothetical protein
LPISDDPTMAREPANRPSDHACDAVPLGDAAAPAILRWTLGNLDEAFRSCIAQLESLGEDLGEDLGDTDFWVGGRGGAERCGVAGEDARFRSCDGPIEREAAAAPFIDGASEPGLSHGLGRA